MLIPFFLPFLSFHLLRQTLSKCILPCITILFMAGFNTPWASYDEKRPYPFLYSKVNVNEFATMWYFYFSIKSFISRDAAFDNSTIEWTSNFVIDIGNLAQRWPMTQFSAWGIRFWGQNWPSISISVPYRALNEHFITLSVILEVKIVFRSLNSAKTNEF